MKITHCKLKKKVQKELLRFFVLEVAARSAADILGIHPNSAVLFYRKIRMVISHHLALAADEIFDGAVELNESYFGQLDRALENPIGSQGQMMADDHTDFAVEQDCGVKQFF